MKLSHGRRCYGAAHVVVTGGEPMIADGVDASSTRKDSDLHVTIETAGTV